MTFSLLDEPWITVLNAENRPGEISVRQALLDGASFRQLFHKTPQIEAALLRLLVVVLWDALQPKDNEEVNHWFQVGFPKERLERYLQSVEPHFDLFGRPYPFWQVNDLTRTQGRHAWTALSFTHSKGNSGVLYDHTITLDPPLISAAEAARYLVADQMFTPPSGKLLSGRGSVAAPAAKGIAVVVKGGNLHETLCFNLFPISAREEDLPVWQREYTFKQLMHEKSEVAKGLKHALTPHTRGVKLHAERKGGNPTVRYLSYVPGLYTHMNELIDPMLVYSERKEEAIPLRFQPRSPAWRRLGVLLGDGVVPKMRRPAVIEHALALRKNLDLCNPPFELTIYGQVFDKTKMIGSYREQARVAGPLLSRPESLQTLLRAATYVDEVSWRLERVEADSIKKRSYTEEKRRKPESPGALAYYPVASSEMLAGLEAAFQTLEAALCNNNIGALDTWRDEVKTLAFSSWAERRGSVEASPSRRADSTRKFTASIRQLDKAFEETV